MPKAPRVSGSARAAKGGAAAEREHEKRAEEENVAENEFDGEQIEHEEDDDGMMLDVNLVRVERPTDEDDSADAMDGVDRPSFPALSAHAMSGGRRQTRRIQVPPHRFGPLKDNWMKIYTPIAEHMKLQIRMNLKSKRVEIRTSEETEDPGALQRAADFVRAFMLGFDVDDALALLRVDDLYIDSFEIKDVKTLHGDHLSRAIGRIAGKAGKTKFTIENASRTRIVLADTHIHILGSYQNIKVARDSIVSLILGSPPGKVYNGLRTVAARMHERF